MQILSIHLKNIKSHRDTELTFSSGINVLSGPNGVGKSTIFEAIGYALFGVDARDFVSNIDRFLSIGSKKGEISVLFRADDGETYRVSRTVGAAAKWLLAKEIAGTFEVEDHARLDETEARVAEILGLANGRPLADQFKLVIGPFQNDFLGPFVIKQATKRQEAFDEILGIDAWRKTYKGTSGLVSAIQGRIKLLTVEVEGKQEQLAVLPEKTAELETNRSTAANLQHSLKEKEAAMITVAAHLTELETREKMIAALTNDLQLLENRVKNGTAKIADQKLRVEESRTAQQIVQESKTGKESFDSIETQLNILRQNDKKRRELEQSITGAEKEALRLTQVLSHERDEIEKTTRQLDEEQKKIQSSRTQFQPDPHLATKAAGLHDIRKELDLLNGQRSLLEGRRESLLEGREKLAEGSCPFFQEPCRNIAGKTPRDVFTSRIADLEQQTSNIEGRLTQLHAHLKEAEAAEKEVNSRAIRLQELDKQLAALEERCAANRKRSDGLGKIAQQQTVAAESVNSLKNGLGIYANLDADIHTAEKEREKHQPARDAYTANLNVSLEFDARLQQLQKMLTLLEELSGEVKKKQAELEATKSSFDPENFQLVKKEKEQLVSDISALRQQNIDLDKNAARLESEIGTLNRIKTELADKQNDIKNYEGKEKLVKFLRNQVFKNVSAQLSERFREEISLRADRIYRTISEADEELFWGDNYQIILKDLQDGVMRERSDDQLSGGQMMSAVVALRLALLQTIGARVAFFDEPTSNLDAARRENLAHAFRAIDMGREEVTEHWYDQLFLVSHDVAFTEITDKVIEL